MKTIRSLPLLFVLLAQLAYAQQDCPSQPPVPHIPGVVSGWPGEHLYLYSRLPPRDCADVQSDACKVKGYLLTGDKVRMAPHCASSDWVYVSFAGKKAVSFGWAPMRRLTTISDESTQDSTGKAFIANLPAACSVAAAQATEWLNGGADYLKPILPSALSHSVPADTLPGKDSSVVRTLGSPTISDAKIRGIPIKAVGYTEGGTCSTGSLELWDAQYKHQVVIPHSDVADPTVGFQDPADDTDWASEYLVQLGGEAYFAHVTRGERYIKLYQLNEALSARPICELARVAVQQEFTRSAANNDLCAAALSGQVEDAGLRSIDAREFNQKASERFLGPFAPPISTVAEGEADPYNEGHMRRVAMLSYPQTSGAGCGSDWNSEWPVILDTEGIPIQPIEHDHVFEHAGSRSRLFRFKGTTYFETRTDDPVGGSPLSVPPTHEVWKFTTSGAKLMCSFNPTRYRPQRVPPY
jgi:hypothetical protein